MSLVKVTSACATGVCARLAAPGASVSRVTTQVRVRLALKALRLVEQDQLRIIYDPPGWPGDENPSAP